VLDKLINGAKRAKKEDLCNFGIAWPVLTEALAYGLYTYTRSSTSPATRIPAHRVHRRLPLRAPHNFTTSLFSRSYPRAVAHPHALSS